MYICNIVKTLFSTLEQRLASLRIPLQFVSHHNFALCVYMCVSARRFYSALQRMCVCVYCLVSNIALFLLKAREKELQIWTRDRETVNGHKKRHCHCENSNNKKIECVRLRRLKKFMHGLR